MKILITFLAVFVISACEKKEVPECPRCEATICPQVPSDVEVLEKYKKDWICIEKHCWKTMMKNAEGVE